VRRFPSVIGFRNKSSIIEINQNTTVDNLLIALNLLELLGD